MWHRPPRRDDGLHAGSAPVPENATDPLGGGSSPTDTYSREFLFYCLAREIASREPTQQAEFLADWRKRRGIAAELELRDLIRKVLESRDAFERGGQQALF